MPFKHPFVLCTYKTDFAIILANICSKHKGNKMVSGVNVVCQHCHFEHVSLLMLAFSFDYRLRELLAWLQMLTVKHVIVTVFISQTLMKTAKCQMFLKLQCERCQVSKVKALFCDRVTTGTVRLCSPWERSKWPLKPTIQPGFCVRMTKRGSKTWNNNSRNSSLKSQNLKVFSLYRCDVHSSIFDHICLFFF